MNKIPELSSETKAFLDALRACPTADQDLGADPSKCRHDYRDGDLCSKCDNPKPLRRERT